MRTEQGPDELISVGPDARVIGRQGALRVVLLQPALVGQMVVVSLVADLGAGSTPVPELDGRLLAIRPSLTALETEPVPLSPDGWGTQGGYRTLACTAFFPAAGHERAPLRLDVTMPLLKEPVSCVFALQGR